MARKKRGQKDNKGVAIVTEPSPPLPLVEREETTLYSIGDSVVVKEDIGSEGELEEFRGVKATIVGIMDKDANGVQGYRVVVNSPFGFYEDEIAGLVGRV